MPDAASPMVNWSHVVTRFVDENPSEKKTVDALVEQMGAESAARVLGIDDVDPDDAATTPTSPRQELEADGGYPCTAAGCGRVFSRPNGLSRHQHQTHGATSKPPRPNPSTRARRNATRAGDTVDRSSGTRAAEPTPAEPETPAREAPPGPFDVTRLVAAAGEWLPVGRIDIRVDASQVLARYTPGEG